MSKAKDKLKEIKRVLNEDFYNLDALKKIEDIIKNPLNSNAINNILFLLRFLFFQCLVY